MPAPYSAGSIFVSVVPSFRNNQRDIEREFKARGREGAKAMAEESAKTLATEMPKAIEKASRQSRQQTTKAAETAASEYTSAFRKTLGEGLKNAEKSLYSTMFQNKKGLKAPIDMESKDFMQSFNSLVRDINLTQADVKVGADVGEAMADIDRLIGQLRRLRDATTNPEVRTDMTSALGGMEDAITRARKQANLQPQQPDQPAERQLGKFDSSARDRVQSALAVLPPVSVDADTTPAMRKVIEFRADAFRLLDDIEADVALDGDDLLARVVALMGLLEGVIETADPEVEVDASFNAAGALAQLKLWKEAVSPTEVEVVPEMGYFRKRMAEATKAAAQALPEVPLDIDADDAHKEMARLRAELMKLSEEVKIGLDLDEAKGRSRDLLRELGALRRDNKISVEVDVDAARAIIELEAVERASNDAERELHRAGRGADDGANSFRAFSGRLLGIAALGPLAIPVIGALGGAFAAAGPLAVAGAAGLGVFALAVSGVSDAVKAMMDVQDNAAKDGKAYADGVRNAGRSLRDAEAGVASARRSAADSAVSSTRRVSDAQKDLADAQKNAREAQDDLTAAHERASERMLDLVFQIRGGALAQRRAYMQLAEAEVAYANALADPGATRTEREQLLLDLDEQKLRVDEVAESNRRLADDQADATSKGLEGSDEVVQANERVANTQEAMAEAVVALADAEQDRQRAAADSARAIESAQLRLADAQQDYADAVAATSSSQDKLAESLAKLSPAGRDFAEYLFSLRGYFSELRAVAQAGILPGVQEWMQDIISAHGPQFVSIVGGMSDAVGDMFRQWGEALQGDAWSGFFDMLESKGPVFLGQIGDVLTSLGNGTASLLTAFAPAAEDFGAGLVGMAARFESWAAGLAQTEGFRDFMEWWERVGPKVVDFFRALGDAVVNIGVALAPYAEDLMELFTTILDWVGDMDPAKLGMIALAILAVAVAFQALVGLNALMAGFGVVAGTVSAAMALVGGTAIGTGAILAGYAAVAALVVGAFVVIALGLYLLYQNSETFRNLVDGIWQGIQSVVGTVVAWFQEHVLPVIETVLGKIGDFFTWLYEDIIEPYLGMLMTIWGVVWDFLKEMWEQVGRPMFDMIVDIFNTLWGVVWPILQLIGLAFQGLWWLLSKAWEYAGKPIFDKIIDIVGWLWEKVIGPVLTYIAEAFGILFGIIKSAWETVGKPIFVFFGEVVQGLVDIFNGSFESIKGIWEALLDVLMMPIVFVVETVLNKGLIAGINHLAGIFTDDDTWIEPIPTDWIPGRAMGGPIPGSSPHKRADNVLIRATAGEYMHDVDATDYYGLPLMDALNQRLIPREALLAGLQGRAYGGLIDPMWNAVHRRFPNARLTSHYRPGDPGYHGSKQAIDVAGSRPYPQAGSTAEMLQINRWMAANFAPAQLIHTQPGAINLLNGKPWNYGRATAADHLDHVHLAMSSLAQMFAGADTSGAGMVEDNSIWGKISDFVSSPLGFLKNIVTNWAGDLGKTDMGEMLLNIPMNFAEGIAETLKNFVGLGEDEGPDTGHYSGAYGTVVGGSTQEQVRRVAERYGWDSGAQWAALSRLIQKESSWNPAAANPRSSARGLFQKMTSVHGPVEPTAAGQAGWGLKYVKDRYGDPVSALQFHDRNNWYARGGLIGKPLTPYLHDDGGVIDPGWNLIYNATRKPEASLNPTQLENIQRIADGGRRGALIENLTVPYAGRDPYDVIEEIGHWADVADRGGKY